MRSTPSEVIAGADLSGKLAVVTGGYSGLGLETTKGLAEAGADVIVPARRPDHARGVLAGLGDTAGTTFCDRSPARRSAPLLWGRDAAAPAPHLTSD